MLFISRRFLPSLVLVLALDAFAAGGGGGEEKAAPVPKDQREYIDKTSKLSSLTNRIEEHRKKFNEAVRQKAAAHGSAAKQVHIKEMLAIHQELNKDVDAYNKVKMELKLRYPNQGEQLERRYQPQTKRSVEELEGAVGLDEMLTRTKKVIDHKYAPFLEEEEKRTQALPTPPAGQPEPPKRLRLER